MNRLHSYLHTASKIIKAYDGSKPLVFHLKHFFSAEKKYGSTDRRTITTLCYVHFRVCHAFKKAVAEDILLAGLFLCGENPQDILGVLRPELKEHLSLPVTSKLSYLNLTPLELFPFSGKLSDDIDKVDFSLSFLIQPALYIRIRPGRKKIVFDKLNSSSTPFEEVKDDCLKLANTTSLERVLKINKDVVIQDANSQHVFNAYHEIAPHCSDQKFISAWDACAASGGKSILFYDVLKGKVELTVSDIRESILINLQARLRQADIKVYKHFVADLTKGTGLSEKDRFAVIILDAPCTGSGTWSRTPEQLGYFHTTSISSYVGLQKKIASGIVLHLEKGGLFFYITCSVFKEENEEIVTFIKEELHGTSGSKLRLLKMEYLKGYLDKADTMFVAIFTV